MSFTESIFFLSNAVYGFAMISNDLNEWMNPNTCHSVIDSVYLLKRINDSAGDCYVKKLMINIFQYPESHNEIPHAILLSLLFRSNIVKWAQKVAQNIVFHSRLHTHTHIYVHFIHTKRLY